MAAKPALERPAARPEPELKPSSASAVLSDDTSVTASIASSFSIRPDASVAARYFTEKAAAEKLAATAKTHRLSLKIISSAHRYFDKKSTQEAHAHAVEIKEMMEAPCTAAIDDFVLRGVEEERRRRTAMEDEVTAPAPVAIKLFSDRADAERARKAEEIRELKENLPPPSVGRQHFGRVGELRLLVMEATTGLSWRG